MIPNIDSASQPPTGSGPTSFQPDSLPTNATPATTAAVAPGGPPAQQQCSAPPPGAGSAQQKPQRKPVPKLPCLPDDYTDVGQASLFSSLYGEALGYHSSSGWLVYNGSYFETSTERARAAVQHFTQEQKADAEGTMKDCRDILTVEKVWDKSCNDISPTASLDDYQKKVYLTYQDAQFLRDFAKKYRSTRGISAIVREAAPMMLVEPRDLDHDPFLLNCPSGTVDLRTGVMHDHTPQDLITKQTAVDPSDDGKDIFDAALDTFFCSDQALIDYVQEVIGLAAIGKVFAESLVIAYGSGKNGKSSFFNAIFRCLGSYAGKITAEVLTTSKVNAQPEVAELRGKRLVIASELDEGMRLSTGRLKHLASTDEITAAKKYLQPITFAPSHSLIMYTNHLPKVGAIDAGTWRRLQVIPFEAVISGQADIKNFGDYLVEHAGGAMLSWIIAGAQRVIANDYHVVLPSVVVQATEQYRAEQNWLDHFIEDCCDVDPAFTEQSGRLYTEYRSYCANMGEYARSTADFYSALDSAGYVRKKTRTGSVISGLQLSCYVGSVSAPSNPARPGPETQ